jgi:hypothetical protein
MDCLNLAGATMRMAFGLVGVLITIGIIVLVMSQYLTKSSLDIKAGNQAREQVKQIGGMSEDQTPAIQSFETDAIRTGGKLDNLLVTKVTPGGAADKYFGLKKDDSIIEVSVGGSLMKLGDYATADPELAKAAVVDAFRTNQQIKVVRNGQEILLPAPGASKAAPASGNPLSQQLDAIQSTGGVR